MNHISLSLLALELSVCKLLQKPLPSWAQDSSLLSFFSSADEISLVCETRCVPASTKAEHGWSCFKVDGTLAFSMIGVIAGLSQVLASQNISIFVISTHDTDYLLVKQENREAAIAALRAAHYIVQA